MTDSLAAETRNDSPDSRFHRRITVASVENENATRETGQVEKYELRDKGEIK